MRFSRILTLISSIFIFTSPLLFSSHSFSEGIDEAEFGLGSFRFRSFGAMDSYDPYTGSWNFTHYDGTVKFSQSLKVDLQRRVVGGQNMNGGHRLGNWTTSFGHVYLEGSRSGSICDQLGRTFVTQQGLIKQFHFSKDNFSSIDSVGSLVSKDGWRSYCWYSGSSSTQLGYHEVDNPRGRDELVFQSPDGTKYIVGKAVDLVLRSGLSTTWVVSRIESKDGDWFNINYASDYNVEDGNNVGRLYYIKDIVLSNGTKIDFIYEKMRIFKGSESKYESLLLDKVVYLGRTLVDYEYEIKTGSGPYREWAYLNRAKLPEGLEWRYESDELEVGSFENISFTSPNKIRGNYSFNAGYDPEENVAFPIAGHVQYSDQNIERLLKFEYEKADPLYSEYTNVITGGTCTQYRHWNNSNTPLGEDLYKRGAVKDIRVYDDPQCIKLLQKTTFDYKPVFISEDDEVRQNPYATYHETRAPVVTKITVTQHKEGGEDVFITEQKDFDDFLNPQTLVSSFSSNGFATQSKVTNLTYDNNAVAWVLGQPKTSSINGVSGQVTYQYFDNGLLKEQNQYGRKQSYTYYSNGDLKTVTNPLNQTTTYEQYKLGTPQLVKFPENIIASKVVDDFGQVTSATSDGRTLTYSYDEQDRPISLTTPAGRANKTVTYSSSANGLLVRSTTGDHVEETLYDGWGNNRTSTTQVSGAPSGTSGNITTHQDYDELGRLTFKGFANSTDGIRYTYDGLSRIKTETNTATNLVTSYRYLNGNRVEVTLPGGIKKLYTYRSYGSPSEQWLMSVQDISASTLASNLEYSDVADVQITRNKLGLIESIKRGNYTQGYTYDSSWQLDTVTTPETGTTDYDYDLAGNLIGLTYQGFPKTVFSYDNLGRIKHVNYGDASPDESNTYYPGTSLLASQTKGDLTWAYTYTDNLELDTEQLSYNSDPATQWLFDYGYNSFGTPTSITYPSGKVLSQDVDSLGRIKSLQLNGSNIISNASYHDAINVTSPHQVTYANGVVETLDLDYAGRMSGLNIEGVYDNYLSRSYGYSDQGAIEQLGQTGTLEAFALELQYDQVGQLRTATGPIWAAGSATYDAIGNIKTKTFGSKDLTYTYNAQNNRLESVENSGGAYKIFNYNDAGAVTANSRYHFNMRADQYLASAGDATLADDYSYEIDARGMRTVSSESPTLKSFFVYGQNQKLMSEQRVTGDTLEYFYFGNKLVASHKECSDADEDGNGIGDCEEEYLNGVNDDPDSDGLTTAEELKLYNTEPRNNDTDNDLLIDGDEITHNADPLVKDTDLDGLEDGVEVHGFTRNNIKYITEPDDADTDDDGLSDGYELKSSVWPTLDPTNADTDGDNLTDGFEVNELHSNPELKDSDYKGAEGIRFRTDGLEDDQEFTQGTNPNLQDTDGDGLLDGHELYGVTVFQRHLSATGTNPTNEDTDRVLGVNDFNEDHDGDGISNGDEYYKYGTDPMLSDTDGDGIPDNEEMHPAILNTRLRVLAQNSYEFIDVQSETINAPVYFKYGAERAAYDGSKPESEESGLRIGIVLQSPRINENYDPSAPRSIVSIEDYSVVYSYKVGSTIYKYQVPVEHKGQNEFWVAINTVDLDDALAESGSNAEHEVIFEVTDHFGNVVPVQYNFRVVIAPDSDLITAPIVNSVNALSGVSISSAQSNLSGKSKNTSVGSFTNTFDKPIYIKIDAVENNNSFSVAREERQRQNLGKWEAKKSWKVYGAGSCSWKDLANDTYYDLTDSQYQRYWRQGRNASLSFGGLHAMEESNGDTPYPINLHNLKQRNKKTVKVNNDWYTSQSDVYANSDSPTKKVKDYEKMSDDNWGLIGLNSTMLTEWTPSNKKTERIWKIADLFKASGFGSYSTSAVITELCPDVYGDWGILVKENALYSSFPFRSGSSSTRGMPNYSYTKNHRAEYGYSVQYRWKSNSGYPKTKVTKIPTSWPISSNELKIELSNGGTLDKIDNYYLVPAGETIKITSSINFSTFTVYSNAKSTYSKTNFDRSMKLNIIEKSKIIVVMSNGATDVSEIHKLPAVDVPYRDLGVSYEIN